MPLDFTFDKINGRRFFNSLAMTTYCGLYRLHSLNKFIDWISKDGHNYSILSTKRMINVHASSYCAGETKNNKKYQIRLAFLQRYFSKTAFVLEVFTPEGHLMETLIFFFLISACLRKLCSFRSLQRLKAHTNQNLLMSWSYFPPTVFECCILIRLVRKHKISTDEFFI